MNKFAIILERHLGLRGLASDENKKIVRLGFLLALLAMAARIFFWFYTGRVWEDSLITILHAENFAKGLGLTHYHAGENPVHGFTSPLSVLIPLIGSMLHEDWGVPCIKLASVLCGGLVIIYAAAFSIHPKIKLPLPLALLIMSYLAFEHHQILWGMAGMETQITTLILLTSFYYLIAWDPTRLGITLGLCMLARPDFAFWTIIAGVYILIKDWRALPRIAAIALAIYLPWIIFATLYYGSPIPNTIAAKWSGSRHWWKDPGLTLKSFRLNFVDRTYWTFSLLGPAFAGHGREVGHAYWDGAQMRYPFWDHGMVSVIMTCVAFIGTLAAFARRRWEHLPIAFFIFIYWLYYVFLVHYIYAWYITPFAAAAILLAATGVREISSPFPARAGILLTSAAATAYTLIMLAVLPTTIPAERGIQQHIENKVRKPMGEYLGAVTKPGETIGCEPLGYISYYSHREIYDWPGLANPKVVKFLKENPTKIDMCSVMNHFRPDYIVLRPQEYEAFQHNPEGDWIDRDYHLDKIFETTDPEVKNIFIECSNLDKKFFIFKKNP